jgi:hypothetical protein
VTHDNHQKFLSHLDNSSSAVWLVAEMLNGRGYDVSIPPNTRAERHSDWQNHADSGDIYIRQRIEVKQLGVAFTCAEDWPFRDKFIVCAKHAFDRATPKPYAYIIVSKCGGHAASVFSSNSASWTVDTRVDSRYEGVEQEFYFSPVADVKWWRMDV